MGDLELSVVNLIYDINLLIYEINIITNKLNLLYIYADYNDHSKNILTICFVHFYIFSLNNLTLT